MSDYKSPMHKLVKFFENSRNSWKEKTKLTKSKLKNSNIKLNYTQEKNRQLKKEVNELKIQLEKATIAAKPSEIPIKKNLSAPNKLKTSNQKQCLG